MRVLLINPPALYNLGVCDNLKIRKNLGYYPPLGILYVASYAEKFTNHTIRVLDAQVEQLDYKGLEERIRAECPDVVGIHVMTFTLPDVLRTMERVKRVAPDSIIVWGGPHPHIYPEESLGIKGVDYVVFGEGEETFSRLIDRIESDRGPEDIKGLVFHANGKVVNTGHPDLIEDLDSLPFPARHLTPYKKYYCLIGKHRPITTMFTSRGCPYKCLFCDRPHLGKVFRTRSPENVIEELESCIRMGIKEFFFYDDTFTVDRRRAMEIADLIIQKKLDIVWDIRARVDNVDKELLERFAVSGLERIHYGVEAGTERILKVWKKGIHLDRVRKVFQETHNAGIESQAYFMIGAPSETREEIMQTINLACQLKTNYAQFSVATSYPATDLYRLGLRKGIYKFDHWQKYAMQPDEKFNPPLWEEILTEKELKELLDLAYRKFYFRPLYMIKSIFKIRSFLDFVSKFKAALVLIKKWFVKDYHWTRN